jgi:hypothetical protein
MTFTYQFVDWGVAMLRGRSFTAILRGLQLQPRQWHCLDAPFPQ